MNITTREPAPAEDFTRIQLGDVGYVRRGRFHLLFSAGIPLGERQLGVDVPLTFKPLDVGPIDRTQPWLSGCLSTITVRRSGVDIRASICPIPCVRSVASISSSTSVTSYRMLEPGVKISFEHTKDQGASLVTKYQTYREDIKRELAFKAYTKRHYNSWVAFARDAEYGDDIRPVLVTGVDMTRDFAMMAYSNSDTSLASEFTTSVPGIASASASAWGTWRTEGLVHTNCGPQLCYPSHPTRAIGPTSSNDGHTETVQDEYNQCVFVRYYTIRRRASVFPTIITASAGPHDLGSGGCSDGESPKVEVQSDSDSGSDIMSSLCDDNDDESSVTSVGSGSTIVIHNITTVRSPPCFVPIIARFN